MSNTESARGIFIVCNNCNNVPVPYYIECVIETTVISSDLHIPQSMVLSVLLCIWLRFYFCVFFVTEYVFSEEIEIFIFIQNGKRGYVRYVKDKKRLRHKR